MENKRPAVGVTVLVFSKEKHLLIGKRLNKPGFGIRFRVAM